MIRAEGKTLYCSGDTDIMADMEWMGDYYKPDIGIMSSGGYFTMDMDKVAYAAKRYFNFKTLTPGVITAPSRCWSNRPKSWSRHCRGWM